MQYLDDMASSVSQITVLAPNLTLPVVVGFHLRDGTVAYDIAAGFDNDPNAAFAFPPHVVAHRHVASGTVVVAREGLPTEGNGSQAALLSVAEYTPDATGYARSVLTYNGSEWVLSPTGQVSVLPATDQSPNVHERRSARV